MSAGGTGVLILLPTKVIKLTKMVRNNNVPHKKVRWVVQEWVICACGHKVLRNGSTAGKHNPAEWFQGR